MAESDSAETMGIPVAGTGSVAPQQIRVALIVGLTLLAGLLGAFLLI